jgi:very-short-patch-repair endonuclease
MNDNTLPEALCLVSEELQFRRQHPFGDYILDFVCLENKLIIEVDGGQHGQQTGYDENRTQKSQTAGFCVLRFWDNEIPIPLPASPLKGEGSRKSPP